MKLSKSLLQALTVGVSLSVTGAACTKEPLSHECGNTCDHPALKAPQKFDPFKHNNPNHINDCPACGMG